MIKIIKILLKHFFYRICNIYYVLIFKAKLVFKKKDSNNLSINSKNIDDYVNKLNENGYVVIKNFFDKEKLIKIDNELKNNPDKFYVYINGVKKKFSDNANYPLLDNVKQTLNNSAYIIEDDALKGWQRGGMSAREFARSQDGKK